MKIAAIAFAALSLIAGAIAAGLWWQSCRVAFPDPPAPGTMIRAPYFHALSKALNTVSKWNRYAAIITGIAALMGAISSVLGSAGP